MFRLTCIEDMHWENTCCCGLEEFVSGCPNICISIIVHLKEAKVGGILLVVIFLKQRQ